MLTKEEKIKLAQEIAANVLESIVKDIENEKVPENWNGIELRELFADRVRWHNMEAKRRKAYNNTKMVNGL